MKKIILVIIIVVTSLQGKSQTGSLDPAFGNGGIVRTEENGTGNTMSEQTRKCFILPDGKILTVLDISLGALLTRRMPDGTVDMSYGTKGFSVPVNIFQITSTMQGDGKIIVAGRTGYQATDFIIARYNTDGSLDQLFGNGGVTITDLGAFTDGINAVTIQNDGKIVVGGQSEIAGVSAFALARYSSSGIPDNTFGNGGIVITDFGSSSVINSVSLQSDNKIVAAGNVSGPVNGDFGVARYNIDGSLDPDFNGNGKLISDFGNVDNALSTVIQSDGKILVGGYYTDFSNSHFEIARYNVNGSADLSFNGSGVATTDFGNTTDYFGSMMLQTDGQIVVGGYTYINGQGDLALARFNSNGSLDNGFGQAGKQVTDLGYEDLLSSLVQQPDGKIVAGGFSFINFSYDFTMVRYDVNGNPDPSFGAGGITISFYPHKDISYSNLLVQPDAKYIVLGSSNDGVNPLNFLRRFNTDGTIDQTYGQNGTTDISGFPNSLIMQPGGKVVVIGSSNSANGGDFNIIRYQTDGNIDPSFGINGTIISDFGGNEYASYAVTQPDGKIVIYGFVYNDVGTDLLIARYSADGLLDNTFGNNGIIITDIEAYDFVQSITIGNDGKILIGGVGYTPTFNIDIIMARYNTDGTLDQSFAQGGKYILDINQTDATGTVLIQNDKKILLGGLTTDGLTTSVNFIRRYNSDGTIDNSFGQNGSIVVDGSGLVLQDDQKILAQGWITNKQNNSDFSIQRFNADGTIDNSFGNNGKTITNISTGNDILTSGKISDNRLVVAGYGFNPNGIGELAKYLIPDQGVNFGCPLNRIVVTDTTICAAKVYGIDPVTPANGARVNYKLTGATKGKGTGSVSGKLFNKGVTNITYTLATDTTKSCTFTVTVSDKEAPVVNDFAANPSVLWPPDHQLKDVNVNYSIADNCGDAQTILSVSSNEPVSGTGSSDQSPDWIIIDNHHIKLRAERVETGNGRIYTIKIVTTDGSQNQSAKTTAVTVPKNNGNPDCNLSVTATPNPSNNYFTINTKSICNIDRVTLKLFDGKGVLLQTINNVLPGQSAKMGASLRAGFYYLEATQLANKITIKLVKY